MVFVSPYEEGEYALSSTEIKEEEEEEKGVTQRVCLKLNYEGRLIKASAKDYR